MKKILKLECPNCKATLEFTEKRNNMFCQYCGTKLLLDDDNEYTYRHIDEAEIKKVEGEQLIRLKELEISEKRHEEEKKITKLMIIISVVLGTVALISLVIATNSNNDEHSGYLIFSVIFIALIFMWLGKLTANEAKKDTTNKFDDKNQE